MSIVNGVWHDAKLDPPPDSEQVLCVKENKKGLRSLCFGTHWKDRQWDGGWVTGGGCNNVIFWMPLPKIPQAGDNVIIHTDWIWRGGDGEAHDGE